MPTRTSTDRLARLERILISPERWVDALLEVRTPDGEVVFRVGGVWDRHRRRFLPETDRRAVAHVVELQASQVEMAQAFANYLRARLCGDDVRPVVLFGGGRRGGGKTWLLGGLALVALALALPDCWLIGVNVTTKQRREVLDAIGRIAPARWITANVDDFRDPRTQLLTGSTIQWLSAKNPAALRQAGLPIEAVFINEAQEQPSAVYDNAIYAIRNTGGIVLIASNPPQTSGGDWTAVLWHAIRAEEIDGVYYDLDARKNQAIHQPSLPKIARALRAVSQLAADADAEGIWRLSGDLAYPGFNPIALERGGHLGEPPAYWVDVTRELTATATSVSDGFEYVAGTDFQHRPGLCAAIGKLYRDGERLILWLREYLTTPGVEEDLSQALVSRGYYPGPVDPDGNPAAATLLVGDATGRTQNAEHRRDQPYSFTRLRAEGWTVLPPMRHWKRGTPINPLVRDSRAQMHALFTRGQLLFSPRCGTPEPGFPSLIDSFKRAKVRTDGSLDKQGHLQHGPDGVRYLAWCFLPRPKPPTTVKRSNTEVAEALRDVRIFERDGDV